MMSINKQQKEVDQNYGAFKLMLPDLLKTDANRYALMHDQQIVACFDTSRDAMEAVRKLLQAKYFSVQLVTNEPVDLGYFSRVGILSAI
ncbi:MAG: hypothetical protein OXD44_12165 [Gammaproteobacteria bacterium]|nr:hypothetical protein [Gammaproteobacteria bacterium]MCY4314418.1 hypothetical protein [Gammaproteobacteria bacterium]